METRSARWIDAAVPEDVVAGLARDANLHPAVARALAARGVTDATAAERFLNPRLADLNDPGAMRDMDRAVERLADAVQSRERVCVYGDYDADGLTATAALAAVLGAVGADVATFVPDRMTDGYGLHPDRVRELAAQGVRLIVTVDCGVRGHDAIALARELGVDVVVIDHHAPDATMPPAVAVVDPHRPDCAFPFKDLCAAGLAFYASGALRRVLTARGLLAPGALDVRDLLDLVAVGTVADMVPLLGDNRILVAAGLRRLNEAARPGLAALKAVSGVDGKPVTAGTVAFALAPRLNATGRLGDPRAALALLRASDDLDARRHAETLQRDNDERRLVAQRVIDEAMARVTAAGGPAHRIVVVWGEGWHPGVVGIAAARLLDAFGRPAVVIGVENGVGKGSCRSVRGFDIGRALESAAPLLERFGGHPMAAGLTVRSGRIPELAATLEALADASVDDDALVPTIALDAWIGLDDLATTLPDDVARMQPFGMGNPEPVLAVRDVVLSNARIVGKDRSHVQVEVDDGRRRCDGIWFGGATAVATIGDRIDVAFSVARDERTGAARMKVRDMRPARTGGADTEAT